LTYPAPTVSSSLKGLPCGRSYGLLGFIISAAIIFPVSIQAGPARAAVGFTGVFSSLNSPPDPSYWTLTQGGSTVANDPDCSTYPSSVNGCVDTTVSVDGEVFVGGINNSASSSAATAWTWQNNTGQNYFVSFDYAVLSNPSVPSSATASFQVGSTNVGGLVTATCAGPSACIGSNGSQSDVRIAPGEYLVFTVTVPTGSAAAGLNISNFNYNVPGPLPATGAATAFGLSRRLRRRIKGELPPGSRKHPAPTHPSSYLNLSPSSLHGLPATFSYTAMPHRPTLANSFPTRYCLPAMPPAPALEPAANDNTAIQA
jgi:hypothetical protein